MKTMIRNAVVALGLLSMVGCATTHIKPYERKTRDYMMDDYASPDAGRSPTQHTDVCCRGFGGVLEPRYIIGAQSLDQ